MNGSRLRQGSGLEMPRAIILPIAVRRARGAVIDNVATAFPRERPQPVTASLPDEVRGEGAQTGRRRRSRECIVDEAAGADSGSTSRVNGGTF